MAINFVDCPEWYSRKWNYACQSECGCNNDDGSPKERCDNCCFTNFTRSGKDCIWKPPFTTHGMSNYYKKIYEKVIKKLI